MLEGAIKLFTVRGIEIRLDYSWFFLFALLIYLLAGQTFPAEWPLAIRVVLGVVTSLLFFLSVLLHELAHSFVAQAHGTRVPRITLFIFGGAAQIAEEPKSARDEFLMAMAGPAMSVAIAIVTGALYYLFRSIRLDPMAAAFQYLALINIMLAVFNLIPGFPLDGGRVLRALMWGASRNLEQSTRVAAIAGQVVAGLFIALGVFSFIFGGGDFLSLWPALIGWFLYRAARQTMDRVAITKLLDHRTVSDLMYSDCLYVDEKTPLSELYQQQVLRGGRRCFPVLRDGRVAGIVSADHLARVPASAWGQASVGAVMTRAEDVKPVTPQMPLGKVLDQMLHDGTPFLPVVNNGLFSGIISREALGEFIRINSTRRRRWGF